MRDATSLTELLKTAQLSELLADVSAQVRAKPDDVLLRQTLFKLCCIEGLWEKALMQLQTLQLMEEVAPQLTELHKNLIFSELIRESVLAGERQAALLEEPGPEWMALLHQANKLNRQQEEERAETLRLQAFDLATESAGYSETTGQFSWIADSDGRIGPACEFISAGGYRQVPFSLLRSLSVMPPKDLLDLIWTPAHLNINGDLHYGYVPARYPLTAGASQDVKLGLRTEWVDVFGVLSTGVGRKMLITDGGEFSLLEVSNITFA
ncbi:type VI secretion system accessory protein TagJ [Pantoea sp. CCBC3-3-1]|uniref:type VI secretion system accessory protein TagJ n=1 Tax=Pantoea sp. CCBC3-3-1 TaxID=2490851 RepID=UPI0011BF55CE|nr:type VI secretion system accessory protein TagJ [Pantoea sp. CCBC3-3-1]